jgi:hypothetical protein
MTRDPAAMSADERLAEVAAILAAGYVRLVLNRQRPLDPGAESVALMTHAVDGDGAARAEDA